MTSVPEPGVYGLLLVSALGAFVWKRRAKLAAFLGLTLAFAGANAQDIVISNFSGGCGAWVKTGTAFDQGPAVGAEVQSLGIQGSPDNSVATSEKQGDGPQGTLTSPVFQIQRDYVSFLIAGGDYEYHNVPESPRRRQGRAKRHGPQFGCSHRGELGCARVRRYECADSDRRPRGRHFVGAHQCRPDRADEHSRKIPRVAQAALWRVAEAEVSLHGEAVDDGSVKSRHASGRLDQRPQRHDLLRRRVPSFRAAVEQVLDPCREHRTLFIGRNSSPRSGRRNSTVACSRARASSTITTHRACRTTRRSRRWWHSGLARTMRLTASATV